MHVFHCALLSLLLVGCGAVGDDSSVFASFHSHGGLFLFIPMLIFLDFIIVFPFCCNCVYTDVLVWRSISLVEVFCFFFYTLCTMNANRCNYRRFIFCVYQQTFTLNCTLKPWSGACLVPAVLSIHISISASRIRAGSRSQDACL